MFKADLIGNLGADAQITSHNGAEFISMSVAHNRKQGEREITYWVSVSLPITFKNALPYLRKAARVYVRGDLDFRLYDSSFTRQKEVGVNLYAKELEIITYPPVEKIETATTAAGEEEKGF